MNISGVNQFSAQYDSRGRFINHALFQTPPWNRIPHKGMETLPQEELLAQIEELGKQWAHATTDEEFQNLSKRMHELEAQFVSSVSPDRKTLFSEGTDIVNSLIQNGSGKKKTKEDGPLLLSFFEYMDIYKGKGKGVYKDSRGDLTWPLSSGGTMTAMEVSPGGIAFEYSVGNEKVLTNLFGEWGYYATKPEQARKSEFHKIIDHATAIEKQNSAAAPPQSGKDKGRLNVTA